MTDDASTTTPEIVIHPDCEECQLKKLTILGHDQELYSVPDDRLGCYLHFDAALARQIVSDGRKAEDVPRELCEQFLLVNRTNPKHLDHVPDPTRPGIIAYLGRMEQDGEWRDALLLIDGSHTMRRQLRDGLPTRAYLLTVAETYRTIESAKRKLVMMAMMDAQWKAGLL